MTVTTSLDKNSLFKNSKINNKTLYEFLLKNKSDSIRAKIFENIGVEKVMKIRKNIIINS